MMRGLSLSPSEYVAQAVRTAGATLTLGVFIGSALTSGIAVGIAAAVLANEKVLRRLRVKAVEALTAARDAALSTQEGRALRRAVLHSGGAVDRAQTTRLPAPDADPQRQLAAQARGPEHGARCGRNVCSAVRAGPTRVDMTEAAPAADG